GRNAMRRGAEERQARQRADQRFDLGLRAEAQVAERRREMAKRFGDRLAGLAVGQYSREREMRMRGEQAQQLARHIAGAAEHDRRYARAAHPASASTGFACKPIASMMWSPSAAPEL